MPHQAPVAAARWWLPVACAALLLLTWGGALDAPFVADDFAHARHALGAERLHDLRISLTGSWHGQGPPWYFRPLAVLSFFADAALYGTHATGWHATSFLLFLASALLLAGATRAVFVRLGLEEALAARAGTIAALSFCVLPSQLEAIAWISNRDGPIATVFGLAALWCWTAGRRGAGALAAALALCAKETAVTWVVLIVALDGLHAWRCAPRGSRAGALRRSLPLAGVLALYFAARFAMFRRLGSGQEQVLAEALGAGGLLHLALNVLAWLRQFPWPVADDLLGAAAVPAGVACAALACAPWLLACLEAWLDGGRPRQDAPRRGVLPAALVGGVAAAVILLGPIVFVTAPDGDLRSSRFT
ncbi:MAG TPA: hypothetical protein VK824_03515, partial [Planctomycetota bacterium]|nr:hypothetical protein [Planctomycetota bacterium]